MVDPVRGRPGHRVGNLLQFLDGRVSSLSGRNPQKMVSSPVQWMVLRKSVSAPSTAVAHPAISPWL